MAITFTSISEQLENLKLIVSTYSAFPFSVHTETTKEELLNLVECDSLCKWLNSINSDFSKEISDIYLIKVKFRQSMFSREYKNLKAGMEKFEKIFQDYKQYKASSAPKDKTEKLNRLKELHKEFLQLDKQFKQTESKSSALMEEIRIFYNMLKKEHIEKFRRITDKLGELRHVLPNGKKGNEKSREYSRYRRELFHMISGCNILPLSEGNMFKANIKQFIKKHSEFVHELEMCFERILYIQNPSAQYLESLDKQSKAFEGLLKSLQNCYNDIQKTTNKVCSDAEKSKRKLVSNPTELKKLSEENEVWLEKLINHFKRDFLRHPKQPNVPCEVLLRDFLLQVHHNPSHYSKSVVQNVENIIDNFGGEKGVSFALSTLNSIRQPEGSFVPRNFVPLWTKAAQKHLQSLQDFILEKVKKHVKSRLFVDLEKFIALQRKRLAQPIKLGRPILLPNTLYNQIVASFKETTELKESSEAYQNALNLHIKLKALDLVQNSPQVILHSDFNALLDKHALTQTPYEIVKDLSAFTDVYENATPKEFLDQLEDHRQVLLWAFNDLSCSDVSRKFVEPRILEECSEDAEREINELEGIESEGDEWENIEREIDEDSSAKSRKTSIS